ncbi:hypothetical protein ABEG18_03065 [Alsobacter sp. KACC 23698]|uniref:UrcA family protein n=1 Tax=Alsobacter sp. KACC 23698 TaxID=3149229 RepID=A0AAU7JHA0_9HYPH
MTKTIAALAGAALLLTPLAMSAIDAASARQTAPRPAGMQSRTPIPLPAPVPLPRRDLEDQGARICMETVRVVASGYGEPAGRRCARRRDDAAL